MAHQNLFEALERITGFTALETDMFEIIEAVDKDKEDQFTQINIEKKIDRTCSNNCSDVCGECQIQTKQTAVEWLIEQIQKQVDAGYGFNPRFDGKVIDQAIQLEAEQSKPHPIKAHHLFELDDLYNSAKITHSRMVEILNEIAAGKHKEGIEI